MSTGVKEAQSSFSAICVERCGGICCDPWWGIISFPMVKEGGLGSISGFRAEVLKNIKARVQRITEAYRTTESPARPLFGLPEKYNVIVKDVRASRSALTINLIAMFAFRCRFLSADKACSIHPTVLGREIRPPHCGWLGDAKAAPGQQGFCRIIYAAGSGEEEALKAIEAERLTSAKSLAEGVDTPEEAAGRVTEAVKSWCEANAPDLLPQEKPSAPGRNDPCWCGSNAKFKKCHGR